MLTHLQNNYGQFMTHKLLERKRIVKKTTYHPQDPIASVLSADEELLKFADITGMLYTQPQAVNITYVIIHRTDKFGLAIREWSCTKIVQKTWVRFKHCFWMAHWELRETSESTIEDAVMHNMKMVRNVVH